VRLARNDIGRYARAMPNPINFLAPVRIGQKFTIAPGGKDTLESYANEFLDDILDSYTKEGIVKALQYRAFTRFSEDATWMTLEEFYPIWVESNGEVVYDLVVAYEPPVIFEGLLEFAVDEGWNYSLTFSDEKSKVWLGKTQNVLVITR